MLAFQRSEDGKSFVAMQMKGRSSEAWTYSSKDKNFRGPMKVDLPGLLHALSKARPAVADTAAAKPAPPRTAPPAPPPTKPLAREPAQAPKPAAKASIPSALPQPVANAVVEHAQATTPPRRRVEINLISRVETRS